MRAIRAGRDIRVMPALLEATAIRAGNAVLEATAIQIQAAISVRSAILIRIDILPPGTMKAARNILAAVGIIPAIAAKKARPNTNAARPVTAATAADVQTTILPATGVPARLRARIIIRAIGAIDLAESPSR